MGSFIGAVAILLIAIVVMFVVKKLYRTGAGSDIAKQAGRILVNETKSILKKLEKKKKSLSNALKEAQNNFEVYKGNCASIFQLEAKLSKDLLEQEKIKQGIDTELGMLRMKYKNGDDESKPAVEEAIKFYLEKLTRAENKIKSLTGMVEEQKTQNLQIENEIRAYKLKIDNLEDKINYVKNQYNIAKNKEILNSTSGSTGGIYDLDEIFRNVNEYINKVDGMTRVVEVVREDEKKEEKINKIVEDIDIQNRLKQFLAEE